MWKHKNFINLQLCATFKHFYDTGTIGTGAVKFRHYSQTEPAATVIKAGTYKWVDTPNIQGIVDIVGSDGGYDGNFESSGISFNGIYFRVGGGNTEIAYSPIENFSSLVENNEVDFVGYTAEAWQIIHSAGEYADIPSLQTFTVLENINLEIWGKDAAEQILTWFTTNTTKLS